MSISNFKLGEEPPGGHTRLSIMELENPEEQLPIEKGCVRIPVNTTCPNPYIKFYLYSGVDAQRMRINSTSEDWFDDSFFQVDKPTVVLMHGYQGGENAMPTVILREAYIKNGSYNLIVADYPALVKERCDRFARLNAEPIAKCTAQIFQYFSQFGISTEKFTCVGFSLGANICGLVANFLTTKMEKIIALDPSGGRPNKRFLNKRLDKSDAVTVHAIHTDTRRFGEGEAVGTADVCVNSGKQPFCKNSINNPQLCSHASSVCFFAESLFPEMSREVEPCFNRCPQPFKASIPDGDNTTLGVDMEPSASGMFCLYADDAPFCPSSPDADLGDPRCCIYTKK